jgi:hypothetical protein
VCAAPGASAYGRFDAFAGAAIGLAFGVIGAKLLYLAVSLEQVREHGLLPS